LKFNKLFAVVEVMFLQNYIKLNATVHVLSCWHRYSFMLTR